MKTSVSNNHLEILIVEDSPTQAEQLRYILGKRNYRVSLTTNGREALKFLERQVPDIVVSDIVMPEMDGYELCKQIRTDAKLKNVPVILVTRLSEPTDVIKGLEAGANNFITKPYDEKYIISHIEYLVANRELRENPASGSGARVFFSGNTYHINAEPLQILDLLLSTYENAHRQNQELLITQKQLRELNERLEEEKAKTESIIAAIGDGISIQDRDLTILYQNQVHISYFGDQRGRKCYEAYRYLGNHCTPCPVLTSRDNEKIHTAEIVAPVVNGTSSFEVTTSSLRDAAGEIIAVIEVARNIDQRKKMEQEREILINDLQEALANIKTLSGLLPICASCKKIRDDSGYWNQIETYIKNHSDATFTHGICPDCMQKLYPEVYEKMQRMKSD